MNVQRFDWGFLETHAYLLEEENHVLVIDPTDVDELLAKCSNAESVTVLLTHEHFDHCSGLNKLRILCSKKADPTCSVIAGDICSERLQDVKANMSVYAEVLAEVAEKPLSEPLVPFTCRAADITFKEHYAFRWMGHAVEMFFTPGHSAGSCCILLDNLLFVGDTVLENKLMAQFPGSSKKTYRKVTAPLLETLLQRVDFGYPGHGEVMTPDVALALARGV